MMFLFINQYSKDQAGKSERPDRHAVGSHVQRNIHLQKRSRIRFKEQSHLSSTLTFQHRMIFPNEAQARKAQPDYEHCNIESQQEAFRDRDVNFERLPIRIEHNTSHQEVGRGPRDCTQSIEAQDWNFSRIDVTKNVDGINCIVPCQKRNQSNTCGLHTEDSGKLVLVTRPRPTSAFELMCNESSQSRNGHQETEYNLHQSIQGSDMDETTLLQSNEQNEFVQKAAQFDYLDGVASLSLYQPVGPGSADPFNAAALPINPFHVKLICYFQRSFTFRSIERLSPKSGLKWIQTLICDRATMHGLYANSLLLAARVNRDSDASKDMAALALKHQNFTIAITRRRIGLNEHLSQVAYATISLLICAYNANDWHSYQVHLNGMKKIVQLSGGHASLDHVLQLLLLVGEPQGASHMLTKPVFDLHDWMRYDWHHDSITVGVRALFDSKKRLQEKVPWAKAIQGEVWKVFLDIREFHWISIQSSQYAHNRSTHSTVQHWLQVQFHFLNISIITCYCGLQDDQDLEEGSNSKNESSLARAFLVALLCCHQLLYHATADPSIIRMGYIPFFHVAQHLARLGSIYEDIRTLKPEILDILMWISFIGACEELSRQYPFDPTTPGGPNSTTFLQIVNSRRQNGEHLQDIQDNLQNFLYDKSVFKPILCHLQCYL
jgi:hypothetical protein